jgi:hypothetical protein
MSLIFHIFAVCDFCTSWLEITNIMNALDQKATDNDHDGHIKLPNTNIVCVVLYHVLYQNTLHSLPCHFVSYKIILGFIELGHWSTDKKVALVCTGKIDQTFETTKLPKKNKK